MNAISFVTVLSGAADLIGLDRANISPGDFRIIRDLADKRLHTAWEFNNWPELMRVERRYYRQLWDATTAFVAGDQRYYPGPLKYYQALTASTNQPPATYSIGVWTTNLAYWAELFTGYTADNYSSTRTYVQGEQAYNPATDQYYQLFAVNSLNNPTTDTTRWGLLTAFDRYVAYSQPGKTVIGEVHWVGKNNPRITTKNREYSTFLSENGVQVLTPSTSAWIEYKQVCPQLKGDFIDLTLAYPAVGQIYFSDGNFYDVLSTTAAGDTPVTQPTEFSVVQIPLIFSRYLQLGIYSDFLKVDGQEDKSNVQGQFAEDHLAYQKQLLDGPQNQVKRTMVLTR